MSDYFVLELFVVPLQVEAAVLSACALNCVFYERAWLLLFLTGVELIIMNS